MRAIKDFNEFIKEGIIKKQKPDVSRVKFLIEETEKSYSMLLLKIEKLGIVNQTANDIVKSCYDLLMELIKAKILLQGYNASGISTHEAEVSFASNLCFNEKDVQFLDEIRYFRNGMFYYGTNLTKDDAERIVNFTKETYLKLKKMTK